MLLLLTRKKGMNDPRKSHTYLLIMVNKYPKSDHNTPTPNFRCVLWAIWDPKFTSILLENPISNAVPPSGTKKSISADLWIFCKVNRREQSSFQSLRHTIFICQDDKIELKRQWMAFWPENITIPAQSWLDCRHFLLQYNATISVLLYPRVNIEKDITRYLTLMAGIWEGGEYILTKSHCIGPNLHHLLALIHVQICIRVIVMSTKLHALCQEECCCDHGERPFGSNFGDLKAWRH